MNIPFNPDEHKDTLADLYNKAARNRSAAAINHRADIGRQVASSIATGIGAIGTGAIAPADTSSPWRGPDTRMVFFTVRALDNGYVVVTKTAEVFAATLEEVGQKVISLMAADALERK